MDEKGDTAVATHGPLKYALTHLVTIIIVAYDNQRYYKLGSDEFRLISSLDFIPSMG